MTTDVHKSSREIEREIERTRSEINETVDAIQDRLSPGQLVDQAMDYFREGSGRSRLVQAVRDNPLAAMLIGIGVGWLLLGMRNHRTNGYEGVGDTGAEWIDEPYRPAVAHGRDPAAGTFGDRTKPVMPDREAGPASPTSVPDMVTAEAPVSGATVAGAGLASDPAVSNPGTARRSTGAPSAAVARASAESQAAPSLTTASTSGSAIEAATGSRITKGSRTAKDGDEPKSDRESKPPA